MVEVIEVPYSGIFNPGIMDDRSLGDEIPHSSILFRISVVAGALPETTSDFLIEDVTTEPEIVSRTCGIGKDGGMTINKNVVKAASITGAKIRPPNPCRLMNM